MSALLTVDDLLKLVRKSGVVDEARLTAFLRDRSADGTADARPLTEKMVEGGLLTNFQAEQFLQGRWRGFTIGQYKYLERIGVGGMGQVFLCEHVESKRRVAIKVLPPAKAEQPAALGRFYREARASAALKHPNIVRTHDIAQDGEYHFIVMDYVAGPNLLDLVKRFGPMEIGRATSYVHQVALALDFAFRNKIIHRDVKPGNVMIDWQGVARLLDLGLARFLNDHGDQLTLKYDDKIVLGTADYVAPEQIENSHAVDTRADIYALGSTFYFLLAGHPPFPTGTVSQKLLWHRTKEPTPIREVRPEVPEALAAILAKMMAKSPKERYQTPAQVISGLESLLPSSIPLPRSEEMPKLSAAAAQPADEGVDLAERETGGRGSTLSDSKRRTRGTNTSSLKTKPRSAFRAPGVSGPTDLANAIGVCGEPSINDAETKEESALQQTISRRQLRPPQASPSALPRRIPWAILGAIIIVALIAIVILA